MLSGIFQCTIILLLEFVEFFLWNVYLDIEFNEMDYFFSLKWMIKNLTIFLYRIFFKLSEGVLVNIEYRYLTRIKLRKSSKSNRVSNFILSSHSY